MFDWKNKIFGTNFEFFYEDTNSFPFLLKQAPSFLYRCSIDEQIVLNI